MNTQDDPAALFEALARHRMTFPELLKHLREKNLMSMAELARKAGLARSHLSMLESGKRRPGFRVIRDVTAALGLQGDDCRLFTERATAASRRPRQPLGGRPPPDIAPWRDKLQAILNIPESPEEKAFLDAIRQKGQARAFTGVH